MNLNKSIKVLVTIILTIMWFLLTYQYSSLISVSSVDLVHFNKLTDLIIFLHIEKTGGSKFEDKLLHNLAVRRKKYWNYSYLFSLFLMLALYDLNWRFLKLFISFFFINYYFKTSKMILSFVK